MPQPEPNATDRIPSLLDQLSAHAAARGQSLGELLEALARLVRGRQHCLSPREAEVLRRIAAGASNAEICAALYISRNTLKTHRKRIRTKLDLPPDLPLDSALARTLLGEV